MSDHGEELREAFETQEHQTPDPAAVYARVMELSTRYKRRRRGLQVAGGSVAAAGLIAAAIQLPSMLPQAGAGAGAGKNPAVVAAAPAKPSAAAAEPDQDALDAWANAGYGYDDAVRLAQLWHSTGDIVNVKAEAGAKLLAGQKLPFKPEPVPPYDPATDNDLVAGSKEDAFFTAGYDYNDAVKLAGIWHLKDASAAKIAGGEKILDGKKLPIKAHPDGSMSASDRKKEIEADKFFAAGYSYTDAVKLSKLWHTKTPYDAKVMAGKKLMAGQSLPIKP